MEQSNAECQKNKLRPSCWPKFAYSKAKGNFPSHTHMVLISRKGSMAKTRNLPRGLITLTVLTLDLTNQMNLMCPKIVSLTMNLNLN